MYFTYNIYFPHLLAEFMLVIKGEDDDDDDR